MTSTRPGFKEEKKDYSVTQLRAESLKDLLAQLKTPPLGYGAAFRKLCSLYHMEHKFPDMSHFRLGPNMFKDITLYLIAFLNNDGLIAHGVMTDILWKKSTTLPSGWQGAVRASYEHKLQNLKKNTLVGLYVRVEKNFKRQGHAGQIIKAMKTFANEQNFRTLIIPLRLPERFKREYAIMSYKKFVSLRGKDGKYFDHWLRLHTQLGGDVLAIDLTSHQHAMNLSDFKQQFNTKKIRRSGYYLSEKQGLFYKAYIDIKRQFALINQECTWVEHRPEAIHLRV